MTPEMTPSRYIALQRSVAIGHRLTQEHPEIVGLYGEGRLTHEQIASELDVMGGYGASKRVARTAVARALRELIPDYDQRVSLRIQHHQAGAQKRYELHGSSFTKEDCQLGARNSLRNLTDEEKRTRVHRAIIAQGRKPWTPEEVEEFNNMRQQAKYLIHSGRHTRLPNMKRIASELNNKFHNCEPVRTNRALISFAYKHF